MKSVNSLQCAVHITRALFHLEDISQLYTNTLFTQIT